MKYFESRILEPGHIGHFGVVCKCSTGTREVDFQYFAFYFIFGIHSPACKTRPNFLSRFLADGGVGAAEDGGPAQPEEANLPAAQAQLDEANNPGAQAQPDEVHHPGPQPDEANHQGAQAPPPDEANQEANHAGAQDQPGELVDEEGGGEQVGDTNTNEKQGCGV